MRKTSVADRPQTDYCECSKCGAVCTSNFGVVKVALAKGIALTCPRCGAAAVAIGDWER